jgi:hypothetical protein
MEYSVALKIAIITFSWRKTMSKKSVWKKIYCLPNSIKSITPFLILPIIHVQKNTCWLVFHYKLIVPKRIKYDLIISSSCEPNINQFIVIWEYIIIKKMYHRIICTISPWITPATTPPNFLLNTEENLIIFLIGL